jgi:hypothetical protein
VGDSIIGAMHAEGKEGIGRLTSRQTDPVEVVSTSSSDKLGNISVRVTPPEMGKHSYGICGLCKRCREMGLRLLGGNPTGDTTGFLQSNVCRLQAPTATGAYNQCFQQVQEDMSKTISTCKDWDFVSEGMEISVGRF